MSREFLRITLDEGIAVVRMNRPDKKNALSLTLIKGLHEVALELRERTDISAVVLAGTDDFFTAGMDIGDPAFSGLLEASLSEQRRLMSLAPRMCQAWEDLEQITIAAVEGFCLGGGVSIACSLDFRVMAESAHIRAPEIDYGMNMSWGTLPRLAHLIGPARAKQLIILAEAVQAREAYAWGFAQWVCPDGEALNTAKEIARKVASKAHAPVCMTKQTVNASVMALDRTVSQMDRDQFLLSIMNHDSRDSIVGFVKKEKRD